MNSVTKQRIIFLDYLRVFAFVSVLISHKFYQETLTFSRNIPTPHITQEYLMNIFLSMFKGGGTGVIVFFMISGYIILHVLQTEKPIEFMIKRFFRIYPLLIVAIAIQVILQDSPIDYLQTIQQMSLMGDFFQTPHALKGVEWTLRVEILFYLIMFLLSFTYAVKDKSYTLLSIFVLITIGLYSANPFPYSVYTKAYFSMYFPFLFIGSTVYMYEKKKINIYALSSFVLLVFYVCFDLTAKYHPNWLQSNFIFTAFLVFILLWSMRHRNYIIHPYIDKYVIQLSLLTFSVYLFHHYLWWYIGSLTQSVGLQSKFWILLLLLLWCYAMYRIIEKPMNKLGKKVSNGLLKF